MRDDFQQHDLPSSRAARLTAPPSSGMRHSIRPRRSAQEREANIAERVAEKREPSSIHPQDSLPIASSHSIADPNAPRWQDLQMANPGNKRARFAAMPVVDSERNSPTVRAFDLLRTRLRQTAQERGWRNIAITAPTSGCGNTFISVNLALSLSRIPGSRTVLMDMNLRDPGVARAFDLYSPSNLRDLLDGSIPLQQHMLRVGDTLALGLNDSADENAAETLLDPATGHILEKMRAALRPDLVLYDMPPLLTHDDVSAFLPQLDGVLMVSDGTRTMAKQLRECERRLDGKVPLLGVVLNRARSNSIPSYA